MPLAFTDEELELLSELARPISQSRRSEFLAAVAGEFESNDITTRQRSRPGASDRADAATSLLGTAAGDRGRPAAA
jgi:hypothetical protein